MTEPGMLLARLNVRRTRGLERAAPTPAAEGNRACTSARASTTWSPMARKVPLTFATMIR